MSTRHVWVRRPYGAWWMQGLVLEWKHERGMWWALVAVIDGDRAWIEWFAQESLRPVHSEMPGA